MLLAVLGRMGVQETLTWAAPITATADVACFGIL